MSSSKRQEEDNITELIRAGFEIAAVMLVLKMDVASGIRGQLGIELTIGLTILAMHIAWVELGEPFEGITKWIEGLFLKM